MAGNKAVWGLDIGQCALKAVKLSFDAKEDRAVVEAFDLVEHPKILSQPDADPEELVRDALNKFLSKYDIEDDLVLLSIPGQQGLARVVKLPPVEAKKVNDIVRFEATQQIPFKLDDVAWDYQVLGSGEETEGFLVDAEVGIFAVKREVAARHMGPLERKGIEVGGMQLAPVALYNFAAFDQFLHAAQKIETPGGDAAEAPPAAAEEEGDSVVILDIGADNTDLVVTNGDSIWLRNLPIGGNHFTRALAKELKLTFAKAEHLKRNATKYKDPKSLYAAMKPVFAEFANELQRSVGFFQSTHRDRTIRKIIGVGNGFKLPGLPKFLQQHLGYPVDKVAGFHGLKGDALAEPTFQENLPSFSVAYGLALQGLKQTPLQTNLLPKDIRTKRLIRDKKPWTLAAAALLLAAFVGKFLGNYTAFSAVHKEEWKVPQGQADSATADFKDKESKYAAAKTSFSSAREAGMKTLALDLGKKRMDWIAALKHLNDCLPPRGRAEEKEDVAQIRELNVEFVHSAYLENLGEWLTSPAFEGVGGDKAKKSMEDADQKAPPAGAGWVFQIRGHTFLKEGGAEFVYDSLLKKLREPRMRELGFSHACLAQDLRDRDWKPSKAPQSTAWQNIMQLLKIGDGAGGGGLGGGGGRGGLEGGNRAMSGGLGEGGMAMGGRPGGGRGRGGEGGGMAMGGGAGAGAGEDEAMLPDGIRHAIGAHYEEKSVPRTDFDVQIVWSAAKYAEAQAKKETASAAADAAVAAAKQKLDDEAAAKAKAADAKAPPAGK